MSLYYENLQPQAEANYAVNGVAFATNKPATFGSTVAITGATTITGALTVTGAISGPRVTTFVTSALVGATVALTASQSSGTFQNVSTSGSPSWTLPAASKGLEFTFLTGNITAGFTITCADSAVIHAKTSATGSAITTTTTLTNTQATAVVGDAIQLVCDGTNWWIKAQTGIFAAS
jgi:hypothetical protein